MKAKTNDSRSLLKIIWKHSKLNETIKEHQTIQHQNPNHQIIPTSRTSSASFFGFSGDVGGLSCYGRAVEVVLIYPLCMLLQPYLFKVFPGVSILVFYIFLLTVFAGPGACAACAFGWSFYGSFIFWWSFDVPWGFRCFTNIAAKDTS